MRVSLMTYAQTVLDDYLSHGQHTLLSGPRSSRRTWLSLDARKDDIHENPISGDDGRAAHDQLK